MCSRTTLPAGTVVTYQVGFYGEARRVGTIVSGPSLCGVLPLYHIRAHGSDEQDPLDVVPVFRVERAPACLVLLPQRRPGQARHVPISTGPAPGPLAG